MSYVDGFVFAVPKKNIQAYKKMAIYGGKIWKKHGVLEYFECKGDDLNAPHVTLTFPKLIKLKKNETVWFSFIIYKSKAHRNIVNAKVMKEMEKEYQNKKSQDMPFDMKRMAYGGFKTIVKA